MLKSVGIPEYNAEQLVACRDKLLQSIQAASGPTSPVQVTPVNQQQAGRGIELQQDQTLPLAPVSEGPAGI